MTTTTRPIKDHEIARGISIALEGLTGRRPRHVGLSGLLDEPLRVRADGEDDVKKALRDAGLTWTDEPESTIPGAPSMLQVEEPPIVVLRALEALGEETGGKGPELEVAIGDDVLPALETIAEPPGDPEGAAPVLSELLEDGVELHADGVVMGRTARAMVVDATEGIAEGDFEEIRGTRYLLPTAFLRAAILGLQEAADDRRTI